MQELAVFIGTISFTVCITIQFLNFSNQIFIYLAKIIAFNVKLSFNFKEIWSH